MPASQSSVAAGQAMVVPSVTRPLIEEFVSVLAQLGVRERVQAVIAAYEHAIVRPGTHQPASVYGSPLAGRPSHR